MNSGKKLIAQLTLLFFVSAASSVATWVVFSKRSDKKDSIKASLNLDPNQERQFDAMESDLNQALQEMILQDSQNKITLCSYLEQDETNLNEMKETAKRMGQNYQEKQEKIAQTLHSISGILNPEQKKIFSRKLMHAVCVSCRHSGHTQKCLCGMCDMKS